MCLRLTAAEDDGHFFAGDADYRHLLGAKLARAAWGSLPEDTGQVANPHPARQSAGFIFIGRALTAPSYSSGFRPHYGDAGGLAAGPSIQLALSLVGQLVFFALLVGFFVFGILDMVNASRIRGSLPSSEQL